MESDAGQLPLSHKTWAWFEANRKQTLLGAGGLLLLGVIVAAFLYWQDAADVTASEGLSKVAMLQVGAPGSHADLAEAYLKVAATYPKSRAGARALLSAAGTLFADGKYPEAKTQFERFMREHPDSPFMGEALLGIAACLDAQQLCPVQGREALMKLTIIGTGYVGLVTGACFAEVGHQVVCVDNNAGKVKVLQEGGIPIYEPGLEDLVRKNVAAGRLSFTTSTAEGVEKSDVVFIAVPTPPLPDGSVDMSFLEKVAREIAGAMTSYKIVVDKSTVPVQTGDKVAETIKRYGKARVEFDVISNPEFLREGFAVEDLMRPDRIVIGVRTQRPVPALKEIYAPFKAPIIVTDINSAELIKHASNSFLALKISYINAIAVLCEATGANVQEVANGMGMD